MMSKHGHKSFGRCKSCKAEVYEKNGKLNCPNCGEISEVQMLSNFIASSSIRKIGTHPNNGE
jgi:uncharacterized Zn finger protein (UPF0148 family)